MAKLRPIAAAIRIRSVPQFRIADAARLLGVSDDTVRRWVDAGTLPVQPDASNRKVIDGAALAAFAREHANAAPDPSDVRRSARNRMVGLVTSVLTDTVMAQVEMQCGPHRVVSLMSTRGRARARAGARRAGRGRDQVDERRRGDPGRDLVKIRVLAAGAVGLALLIAGCGGGSTPPARRARARARRAGRRSSTVFAAASLNETFTDARQAVRDRQPRGHGRSSTSPARRTWPSRSSTAPRPTCSPRPATPP